MIDAARCPLGLRSEQNQISFGAVVKLRSWWRSVGGSPGSPRDVEESLHVSTSGRVNKRKDAVAHLLDDAPTMVWLTDVNGSCTFLNRQWYEFTGQTSETGLGTGWAQAVHPDDREPALKTFRTAHEKRAPCSIEYRLRNRDGSYRWAIDSVAPHFGTRGEFLGLIGMVADIHDRKIFEQRLQESEEQARAFFERSGVGAARVGADDLRFQKVNDRLCEITGYSREELLQMGPIDLDHPDEREADQDRIRRVLEDPEYIYDVEKRYLRKDGRTIWVYVNAALVRDSEGKARYSASIIQDITNRKQAEEALRQSEQTLRELSLSLEHRVTERTAELREQAVRLQHLAADLTSAEQRERKRLAALLHDDLQQLLVAASMHLRNVSRRIKDDEDRKAVQQSAKWVTEAIGAARTLTLQLRPPALYEDSLVAALHGLASEMTERHHLTVSIEGGEGPLPVSDDLKALLFESIRELLFNVAKHADADKAVVRVWQDAQRLHVLVADAGKGFDVRTAEQSKLKSGFGLFSIHERLAAFDGKLSIASTPGHGTRIILEVPLYGELQDAERAIADKRRPQKKVRKDIGAPKYSAPVIRVVVVDDHAMVRQGLATLLQEDDRLEVVSEAADGLAAIEAVEQQRPDVLLVDLNMPRMNGIEATREIHRRWPETVIIGLSVQDDDATAKAFRDAGAAAFLPKAGDSDRMITTIVELGNALNCDKQ